MTFWVLAALMTAAVVIALLWPLMRRRAEAVPAASDYDREVYRDQLTELSQDRARGLINDSEAEAAQREIERRLLQTEADGGTAAAPSRGGGWARRLALALVIVLPPVAGVALYLQIGTPGLPDMPLAGRDPGGPKEAALMVQRLQDRLAADPHDIESRLILAQVLERMGRYAEAADAYRAAIAEGKTRGKVPAALHAALGETLVAAAKGKVGRDARLAFAAALEADPGNARARYYAGLAMAQDGHLENAIKVWHDMAGDVAADSPWVPLLTEQINRAAKELGIEPPAIATRQAPAAPGPSAADVQAAGKMAPQERMAFIRSMVDRLASRLATDPADPDGWLRLARAYSVLGETDKAHKALTSAEQQIAALPADAPERAGLTQRLETLRKSLP